MRNKKKLMICEGPLSLGSPTRGTEEAFSYMTEKGLAEFFSDRADLCRFGGERILPDVLCDSRLRHLETVMSVCRGVYKNVLSAHRGGYFPVVLGGDHSLVMSSVAAAAETVGAENLAVIYVDAHTDINTEATTHSGMIHGMPLAETMGLCTSLLDVGEEKIHLYGRNTYIIGAHSIDDGEYPIIEEQGVHLYTAGEVRRRGYESVVGEVLAATAGMKVHLSFDVDSIDGCEFPATGYALAGSLSYKEVFHILEAVTKNADLISADIVEYNPSRDADGQCLEKMLEVFSLLK